MCSLVIAFNAEVISSSEALYWEPDIKKTHKKEQATMSGRNKTALSTGRQQHYDTKNILIKIETWLWHEYEL